MAAASIMQYRNTWGSAAAAGQGIDQIRGDLFVINMTPPTALPGLQWDELICFAVTTFPFPARDRETIPVKFLNQTNFQLGAETALAPLTMKVRHPFNVATAQLLEQWHWATSNPNGAVALTSAIKTNGTFSWLSPVSAAAQNYDMSNPTANGTPLYNLVCQYVLEGCLVKGLKPTDADMESNNNLVYLEFQLQVDRYYPLNTADLVGAAS